MCCVPGAALRLPETRARAHRPSGSGVPLAPPPLGQVRVILLSPVYFLQKQFGGYCGSSCSSKPPQRGSTHRQVSARLVGQECERVAV